MEIPTASNRGHTGFALFERGFRPFFSAAGIYAVVAMFLWMLMYGFSFQLPLNSVSPLTWHAHEMVYGYAMAVVAGFLLTAVTNWTGLPTLLNAKLFGLLVMWLLARIGYFISAEHAMLFTAMADTLFVLGLIVGIGRPIMQVRQWQQAVILAILVLVLVANSVFYAGVLGYLEQGIRWGLYSGLYLIISLVLVMSARVLPAFIKNGVDEPFEARPRTWADKAGLLLFILWAVWDIFVQQATIQAWLSLGLFVLLSLRMVDWYTPGIWKKPLLWSLFLGYFSLAGGFLLTALVVWFGISPYLPLHAFAVGGIGLITIGMMSRVSLGHTGRNVFAPPGLLRPVFALIVLAAVTRVVLPLLFGDQYALWISVSQVFWILGYLLFCWMYIPQLIRPRVDGQAG